MKHRPGARARTQAKKRMGCLPRMIITIVFIAVVLVITMMIHFQYLKSSNQEITLADYLTFTWESTKEVVADYKDWLTKSEKTLKWLDKLFPPARKTTEGPAEAGPVKPKPAIHPEFQAAADEFRAGLLYFRKQDNNKAYKRFIKAQEHLEKYKKINPKDQQIKEFETELAKYIYAAMKGAKIK